MPSVSNLGQSLHMRSLLASVRTQISITQEQQITGMKASSFGGLGASALGSLSIRGQLSRIDAYKSGIEQVIPRTEIMNDSMVKIAEAGRNLIAEVAKYPRNDAVPVDLMNEMARNARSFLQQQLNSQIGGRYLFAGTDTDTPPMAQGDAIGNNIQSLIDDFMAGTADAAALVGGASAITGQDAGYSAALATTGRSVIRADEGYDVDYTVLADAPGFQQIMQGMSLLEKLQYDPANAEEFWKVIDGAIGLIDKGARGVDQENAKLGAKMQILDDMQTRHGQSKGIAQRFLASTEEVDVADAITRLQTLQTQLQAAYEAMSMLRDLSLVNYLR